MVRIQLPSPTQPGQAKFLAVIVFTLFAVGAMVFLWATYPWLTHLKLSVGVEQSEYSRLAPGPGWFDSSRSRKPTINAWERLLSAGSSQLTRPTSERLSTDGSLQQCESYELHTQKLEDLRMKQAYFGGWNSKVEAPLTSIVTTPNLFHGKISQNAGLRCVSALISADWKKRIECGKLQLGLRKLEPDLEA